MKQWFYLKVPWRNQREMLVAYTAQVSTVRTRRVRLSKDTQRKRTEE